jgi:hypothetical protein
VLDDDLQGIGDLSRDTERLSDRKRPRLQARGERLSFDELQDEELGSVRFFQPIDRSDVRMIERSEEARFALKARDPLRIVAEPVGDNLDRDVAAQPGIAGAIDLSHPAGPDGRVDLIQADANAGLERHLLRLGGIISPEETALEARVTAPEAWSLKSEV